MFSGADTCSGKQSLKHGLWVEPDGCQAFCLKGIHGNACRNYSGISGFSAGSLSGQVSFDSIIKWRIMYIMLNKVSDHVSQSFSSPFTPLTKSTTHSTTALSWCASMRTLQLSAQLASPLGALNISLAHPQGLQISRHRGVILVRINTPPTTGCTVRFALRRFNHVFSSSSMTTLRENFPVIAQRFCQISCSAIGLFAEYRDVIQVRINAHPAMPLRTAQSQGRHSWRPNPAPSANCQPHLSLK